MDISQNDIAKILISVIVPVYNVEQYIERCVNSIIDQSHVNLEILLVDDGTPDNSGRICEHYAVKDNRIIVIHKANGGLSDARNVALDIAKGEYIVFVDSDDYIGKDHIFTLLKLILKHDVKLGISLPNPFIEGEPPSISSIGIKEIKYSNDDAVQALMYQHPFDNNAWAKIYHKSLFSSIRYPKGLLYEDVATTYKLILRSDGVVFVNDKSYFYLLRTNSIEGSPFSVKKFESLMTIIKDLEQAIKDYPIHKNAIECRIVSLLFHVLFETPPRSEYESKLLRKIDQYKMSIVLNPKARTKSRIACIILFAGIKSLRFIYSYGKSR